MQIPKSLIPPALKRGGHWPSSFSEGYAVIPLPAIRLFERWAATLLLCLLPFANAWATCTAPKTSVSFPATISVPRDAAVGTVLATVITTTTITCNPTGLIRPYDASWFVYLAPSNPDSGAAPVANTRATNRSGIGLQWSNLNPHAGTTSIVSTVALNHSTWGRGIASGSYRHSPSTTFTDTWTLVKTGPIAAGTLVLPALSLNYKTPPTKSNIKFGYLTTYNFSNTQIAVEACTTQDVAVPMGEHSISKLRGRGTTTTAVAFNIGLNNCPGGVNSIQYRIDPVTAVLDDAQSVVALNGGNSSATGVGVQLLDGTGKVAFPLGSYRTFGSYNPTTTGYIVPFKARYYQTSTTVTPGVANTSLTFTMQYQ